MKRQKIFFVCIFFCFANLVQAQSIGPSTINSSGTSKTIGSDTYEYSIGEMTLVNTATSSVIIVTQGVLQPSENTAGINENTITENQLKVFPVPSSTVLNIQPSFQKGGKLLYQLFDASGRGILKQSVDLSSGTETQQINIAPYASGNYMLHIRFESGNDVSNKTFKVQKIQ